MCLTDAKDPENRRVVGDREVRVDLHSVSRPRDLSDLLRFKPSAPGGQERHFLTRRRDPWDGVEYGREGVPGAELPRLDPNDIAWQSRLQPPHDRSCRDLVENVRLAQGSGYEPTFGYLRVAYA